MTTQAAIVNFKSLTVNDTLQDIESGSTPPSPSETEQNAISPKQIRTLQDAWTDAKKLFAKNTENQLNEDVIDIEKVLVKWQKQFEDDDDSDKTKQRRARILNIYNNIKDGLHVLARLVEPGVMSTFGFAGPTINALTFLLDIPGRISDFYDTLVDLFEEVENFLSRFKILNRLDRRHDLSVEMILSASNMLICFVNVCGVAYKALKHRKRTMVKAALLQNDSGVGDALTEFRQKALHLDRVTSSATLEGVYDVRRTARELNVTFKNVLKSMELTNTEVGRSIVYAKRHATIKEKIYTKEEITILEKPSEPIDLLPDTLHCLEEDGSFRHWRDDNFDSNRAAVVLQGPRKSGKSSLMKALKEHLDEARENPDKLGSIYVAYHDFTKSKTKGSVVQIPFALRNMAMQVAVQSTAYASELETILKSEKTKHISGIDSLQVLWNKLRLSTFEKKAQQARMYLLFDGIELESQDGIRELYRVLMRNKPDVAKATNTLSIRIAFTAERPIIPLIPSIDITSATRNLVRQYASRELKKKGLFQFGDSRSSNNRDRVIRAMENAAFNHVEYKLEHIRYEYGKLSNKRLEEILQDETGQLYSQKGAVSLNELSARLGPSDIDDLNLLLPWLLYSEYQTCLIPEEIEAILYLKNASESLQSFQEKISGVYRELFCVDENGFVSFQPGKEFIFREAAQHSTSQINASQASISMDLSIKNAERSVLRKFIWQLNEGMSTDRFDFDLQSKSAPKELFVNQTRSHVDITKLCLELLNEGWKGTTEFLVGYALQCLPYHFEYLAANIATIPPADREMITYGLVRLLSGPYHLLSDNDIHFGAGDPWLIDTSSIEGLRKWLDDTKDQLRDRERKWIETALAPSKGRLGHMDAFARAVGKKWLRHHKENAVDREYEPEVRISNGLESRLFRWLDLYIENNTDDTDINTTSNYNDEATEQTFEQANLVTDSHDVILGQTGDTAPGKLRDLVPSSNRNTISVQNEAARSSENGTVATIEADSDSVDQEKTAISIQNESTISVKDEHVELVTPTKSVRIEDHPVPGHESTTSMQNENTVSVQNLTTPIVPISPDIEQDRLKLTRTESTKEMSISDKIDRAIAWIKDEEVAYLDKGIANINIGYTYMYHGDHDKAEKYFNQAMEKPAYARQSLIAMGRLCYARGDKKLATEKFREGLAIFEKEKPSETRTPDESEVLAGLYCELATVYEGTDTPDLTNMIDLYRKSLRCNDNMDIRWKLFTSLCMDDEVGLTNQGLDMVMQWISDSVGEGDDVIGKAIRKTAEADPSCYELEKFVHSIRDDRLLEILRRGFSAAISIEDLRETAQEVQIRGKLLYLKGLVIATTSKESRWSDAVVVWEDSFALADFSSGTTVDNTHFSYASVCLLAQHHLDSHLADLRDVDTMSLAEDNKEARLQRLVMDLNSAILRESVSPPYFIKDAVRLSMTSFNVTLGRHDEARKLSMEVLSTAINILSDDDTDNDSQGVESLMRILWSVGDKIGAITAFSLNDRTYEERSNDDETQPLRIVARGYRYCDKCLKDFMPELSEGRWVCSSCYDFDLCLSCYEKWMQNKLTVHRCNKDLHQLLRVCHVDDYATEEKSGNMVLIDWKWEDCGNGAFKRNGGRLVPFPEWFSILKEKWGITTDYDIGMAQK